MWSHYALLKKLKNGLMEELCRTKFKHWEYEKEIRLFLTIEDAEKEGKHLFADFDNEAMKLREIVMGSNYESCGEFEKLGVSLEDDISIITARCAFQNFSIVKQHCKKMQKTI
ncbi:MAG: hypothetical protein COA85_05025 [Robiginitomaculum sp.]|nr:MAG: hypothetical protein COA85_05025 [Robiginitomaculum sp.]